MNHATTLPYKPIEPSIPLHYDYCPYRLPCGLCQITHQHCFPNGWQVTCNTDKNEWKMEWGSKTNIENCNT